MKFCCLGRSSTYGPAALPDDCGNLHDKAGCDLANLNAADEQVEHKNLLTNFTELKTWCLCAEVSLISSFVDLAKSVFRLGTTPVAGDVSSGDPL